MSDMSQANYPNWSDQQWSNVTKLVSSAAQGARVAAQYLPLYGPVDPSLVAVPDLLVGNSPNPRFAPLRATNRLNVDSSPNTYLATLSVQVPLANHEVAEPELQAAMAAFRRAAVTIARLEDALIFNGQPAVNVPPVPTFLGGWLANLPPIFTLNGGAQQPGLVPAGATPNAPPPLWAIPPRVDTILQFPKKAPAARPWPDADRQELMGEWGQIVVRALSDAIGALEGNGHAGPFACFLAPDVFEAVHTPSESLVLPRDRIIPFLGGEYLSRSNTIPNGYGIVVAGIPQRTINGGDVSGVGAGPVEIVVATDISVRYLQQTTEPKFLFRISEKIALRVKEWDAVAVLRPA